MGVCVKSSVVMVHSLVKLIRDGFPRVAGVVELDHAFAIHTRNLRAAASALRGQSRPHAAAQTHRRRRTRLRPRLACHCPGTRSVRVRVVWSRPACLQSSRLTVSTRCLPPPPSAPILGAEDSTTEISIARALPAVRCFLALCLVVCQADHSLVCAPCSPSLPSLGFRWSRGLSDVFLKFEYLRKRRRFRRFTQACKNAFRT